MKYHSTKNTIITIMIIVASLFMISFIGIKYLNAKTPVEAVANALVENLELPSDYSIQINNINKSFLSYQKIDSVEIKKGDKTFLKLENVELRHSVFDYFKLIVFKSHENLLLSADLIEINYTKEFYDVTKGVKGLKIRDNTFSRISNDDISEPIKVDNPFDLDLFRQQIKDNGAINVSPFLPEILKNSSIDLSIKKGSIDYDDNNIKANTQFKDFKLSISSDSYLNKIQAEVTKLSLSNNQIDLKTDYATIDFEKTNININCDNLAFNSEQISLSSDAFIISYSLLDLERATLKYNKLHALYNDVYFNISEGNSKIDSNFKDFSIYNSFDNVNINMENSTFDSLKIDLNASYVNNSLAIELLSGEKNYIRDERIGELDFSNLFVSLNSDSILPSDVVIKLDSAILIKDSNTVNVSNFDTSLTSDVDSTLYLQDDGSLDFSKLNIENLKQSYQEVETNVSSQVFGYIKSIDNDFSANINSSVLFEDSFNQITATLNLEDISLTKINDELNVTLAYQGPISLENDKLKMLEGHLDMGDSIKSAIIASSRKGIKDANLEGNVEFNDFKPSLISYYVNNFVPLFATYVSDNTTVNGSLNFSGNYSDSSFLKVNGDVDSSLVLNDLVFGTTPINIGLSLSSELNESTIDFSKFSIASFGYRLSGSGDYNASTNLSNMNFAVSSIKNGTKLFTTSIYPENDKFGFKILIPSIESFSFSGMINQLDDSDINLTTKLDIANDSFPVTVNVNRDNYNISAFSDKGLDFKLNIGKSIKASLVFDNLFSTTLDNSYLAGALSYNASDIGDWEFDAKDFLINYNEGKIIFGFDAKINSNEVLFSDITFKNNLSTNINNNTNYLGDFSFKKEEKMDDYLLNPYSMILSFGDGREQNIDVVASNDGFSNHIFVDVSNVNFAPLLQLDSDLIFNFRLVGDNNEDDISSFRGTINLYDKSLTTQREEVSVKESNRLTGNFLWKTLSLIPFIDINGIGTNATTNSIINVVSSTNLSLTSNISVEKNLFSLSSLNLKSGDLKISDATINFDANKKEFDYDSSISYLKHSKNTNQNSSADLSLNLNFDTFYENIKEQYYNSVIDENSKLDLKKLFNKVKELIDEKGIYLDTFNGVYGNVKLDNIDLFKDTKDFEKLWPDTVQDNTEFSMIDSDFKVEDLMVKFDGKNLNGIVDLVNKDLKINIDKNFGIGLSAEYDYSNNEHNLIINNLYFPLNLLSKSLYINTMKIYGGALTGDVLISSANVNPKFYGTLNIDRANTKLLWLKNQEVTLHNASLNAFGNDIIVRNASFDVYNSETNTISKGLVDININYIKGSPFSISFDLDINDYVYGFFPMIGNKISSEGYVKGNLIYTFDDNWSYIDGGLIVKDATIKGEIDPLPSWISSSKNFSSKIELQTGSNVTVFYPTVDNPILKATLTKDQNFGLDIDNKANTTSAEGKVSIAQGELFYFQKNFFINSGSITFGQDISTERLKLLLSLNATLKEYDSDGNDVDINLLLNNSSIDNLNPVFSSSPAKTKTEIMSILGQSVTGTSSDGSIQVSNLASAATSVFSTLGYINTGGVGSLNQTIANTLNLDIFSLNSNIVENLLLDTLSVDDSSISYSPLARYLDNTSIYMGKYISNDSYLQLIINLLAEKNSNQASFLASDLTLDFEVTYDIDTPLAKFSIFTNPQQLSIIDILDTIGLSVTKTIYLR